MRRFLLGILWPAFATASLALAGGFGGALHPLGDSLAVFRLYIAGACVALAVLIALISRNGRWRAVGLGLAAALAAAPAAVSYWAFPSRGGPHAIYQKNLLFRLGDPGPVVADILASRADIVTLQEVNGPNLAVMEALRGAYPAQAHCRFGRVGGTAVLSRWPAIGDPVCAETGGLTALRVAAPDGPLWVVSVHLHWPWPHGQARHVERLLPVLSGLEHPVLVGGDFNMVPWGQSVRRIAAASGTQVSEFARTTFLLPLEPVPLPLSIDHVLVPEGWGGANSTRPELGSDHRGVLARFGP